MLVRQVGEFAAGLHALEVPGYLPAPDPMADLQARLAAFEKASPVFELALHTLEAESPPDREPVIVHGDLRLGNLIVGPDSLLAVIDWELVHAGNPAEDLGWFCVKAWRFGVDAPAAGLGSREELLAAYLAAGGAGITMDELRWWEIFGTLRWGVICLEQAQAHLSGAHRSVELAAVGRRVCEQEWDLLLLLGPPRANCSRPYGSSSPARSCRPPPGSSPTTQGSRPTCWASWPARSNSARSRPKPGSLTRSPPSSPSPTRGTSAWPRGPDRPRASVLA